MPRLFDIDGQPLYRDWDPNEPWVEGQSLMPFFPGYSFEMGKSVYKGIEVGEGGFVYAQPGIYRNVYLLDIASMHPTSIRQENLLGKYTQNYGDIVDTRLYIKHGEYDKAKQLFDGKLAKYLTDEKQAERLSKALKIPINSLYGLTAAKFDNPVRDKRNVDNIVAKRGALFMVNLKEQVEKLGYTVVHIKTDSIKIADGDEFIKDFVTKYGREYGYEFEHEATYDRICLVNDAVYIARYNEQGQINKGGKHPWAWTATGTQFQVPYVFKTLFSHEPIEFWDMCETKSSNVGDLYLDYNEGMPAGEHNYTFVGKVSAFCPVKDGLGGGELVCQRKNKDGDTTYAFATGCKGWRWKEAEDVQKEPVDIIDIRYYRRLVDEAMAAIEKYGSFEEFAR